MSGPSLEPTRITDWHQPRLPLLLRAFNAIAERPTRKRVHLDLEWALAEAKKQTGLDDFGD